MAKTLPVVRLATHKLIVSDDAVVGVELLATTLSGKHMDTVLPNSVLTRHLLRLESLKAPLFMCSLKLILVLKVM